MQMLERILGSSVDSGKVRGFFLRHPMVQLVCRVCYSLEMLLMRWDTCCDLDEGQNLTTIDDPHSRVIRRVKLIGALKYFRALLEVYTSEDLLHYFYESLKLRLEAAWLDDNWRVN